MRGTSTLGSHSAVCQSCATIWVGKQENLHHCQKIGKLFLCETDYPCPDSDGDLNENPCARCSFGQYDAPKIVVN